MARNIYYKKKNPLPWIGLSLVALVAVAAIVWLMLWNPTDAPASTDTPDVTTTQSTTTTTAPEYERYIVTDDGVNVRMGPGTEFEAVTSMNAGDEVIVLAKEGDWYRIELSGEHYFISAQYVTEEGATTETTTETEESTTTTTDTTAESTTSSTKKTTSTAKKYSDRYIDEEGMLQFKSGDNYVQANSYPDGNIPWNLLLVNDWNPMPKGYDETLTMVKPSPTVTAQPVDARIEKDLEAMLKAGKAYNIGVQSAYRPSSKQSDLYWNKVAYYKGIYSDPVEIQTKAGEVVKRPGFSEHNTGLAVDLYGSGDHSLTASFANTKAYKWLMENCADYGFILRFPKGKENITGVIYEAWHFRYVGDPAIAHEIMDNGLCLEEYLAQKGL